MDPLDPSDLEQLRRAIRSPRSTRTGALALKLILDYGQAKGSPGDRARASVARHGTSLRRLYQALKRLAEGGVEAVAAIPDPKYPHRPPLPASIRDEVVKLAGSKPPMTLRAIAAAAKVSVRYVSLVIGKEGVQRPDMRKRRRPDATEPVMNCQDAAPISGAATASSKSDGANSDPK